MSRLTVFFFFNDTATTEIYTLSLHDALPIYRGGGERTGGMMHLLPHNTALLVIDVSRACDETGGVTGGRNNPGMEANIGRLEEAWRESGRPIIRVQHDPRWPGAPTHYSAFVGTNLEAELLRR